MTVLRSLFWQMNAEILFDSHQDLPEDQCIFVRGFRATRTLKILPPRLKGAAEPTLDPEGDEEMPDAELMPIPTLPEVQSPRPFIVF
jgi:hypothetical protein